MSRIPPGPRGSSWFLSFSLISSRIISAAGSFFIISFKVRRRTVHTFAFSFFFFFFPLTFLPLIFPVIFFFFFLFFPFNLVEAFLPGGQPFLFFFFLFVSSLFFFFFSPPSFRSLVSWFLVVCCSFVWFDGYSYLLLLSSFRFLSPPGSRPLDPVQQQLGNLSSPTRGSSILIFFSHCVLSWRLRRVPFGKTFVQDGIALSVGQNHHD